MRLEGSGTPTIAMPSGPSNPEISEEFTVAPEVVYSPIVPMKEFTTNKSVPDTAMPHGLNGPNPEISREVFPLWLRGSENRFSTTSRAATGLNIQALQDIRREPYPKFRSRVPKVPFLPVGRRTQSPVEKSGPLQLLTPSATV